MTDEQVRLRDRATLQFFGAATFTGLCPLVFTATIGNAQLNGIAALSVLLGVISTGATIALAKNLQRLNAP